jgi:hypothetical protein
MFAATAWWALAARLSLRFLERGTSVAALCPIGHPLRHVPGIDRIYTYRALGSLRSLESALELEAPDLVVPCDDRVVWQLHELHSRRPRWRPLVEASLGDPRSYPIVRSRERLLALAAELGIDVPETAPVRSEEALGAWLDREGPRAVLKIDGTWAGEGVRIVDSREAARRSFQDLSRPSGLSTALKRTIVNRDTLALWAWRNAGPPAVTVQRFVTGHPANAMLACFQGRLLGAVCVEVLSSEGPTGAAVVIRLLDSPRMRTAAERLVERLGLTGFCGLDFVIDDATFVPYLIEMNPRCTQLGHLSLPGQGDLAGLLLAQLPGGAAGAPPAPIAADTIALFPQYLAAGAAGAPRPGLHHDVPQAYPELVAELSKPTWPERRWIARCYHFFRSQRRVPTMDFRVAGAGPEEYPRR